MQAGQGRPMRSTTAALSAVLALTAAGLSGVQAGATPPQTPRPVGALARLTADTRGGVRLLAGPTGSARVVAVSGEARNPVVGRTTGPRMAARDHLARYGAVLGVADRGTRLLGGTVSKSVTGDDVVRFTQQRQGLPVIGGAVAVDLRPDRQLGSMTASVSRATVPPATYPAEAASRQALAVATKELGHDHVALSADAPVRELYDPAVLGVRRTFDPATHARGVWSVEVHAGPAFHRLLLLDDQSGAVVRDIDLVEQVNRVVCDDDNALTTDFPCKKDFARTETSGPSTVPDVNDAFRLAGVVSAFYHRLAGIDLTRLLGVKEGDHKSLSSTVRFCNFALPQNYCPYRNAFWNGQGMFYGQGFASAQDVVGHEMTHGVIQHNSDLFYWGQSGAINESIADIMGEILDHQRPSPGDSMDNWLLGEALPGGAIRDLRHPGRFGQPSTMTSKRYARGGDDDNGGVHTNSGVGNRTFYLISQGGEQGGQTVHGIDSGPQLTKSATLYLAVIQHLVSGSDYADLAAVLDSSCRDLATNHVAGMTSRNCANVHRATLATRLRTTPPRAKQPPDAPMTCPKGTGPVQVLFDSETGRPRSKFDAGSTWGRAPIPDADPLPVPANATSGHRSWYSSEPQDTTVSSLTMHPVALPAGQPAYLWFQQWRFLESGTMSDGTPINYDAGTVEVVDTTQGTDPQPAEGLHWVNGPHDLITDQYENPAGGRVGFSRDSHGYLASRMNLTKYAGDSVSPQFTMNTDNSGSTLEGWYLDDIRVYTCGGA
jgi:bacillolysin